MVTCLTHVVLINSVRKKLWQKYSGNIRCSIYTIPESTQWINKMRSAKTSSSYLVELFFQLTVEWDREWKTKICMHQEWAHTKLLAGCFIWHNWRNFLRWWTHSAALSLRKKNTNVMNTQKKYAHLCGLISQLILYLAIIPVRLAKIVL